MPTRPNEVLKSLELAGDYLQQFRRQLVTCDLAGTPFVPTLERVAGLLESLQAQPQSVAAHREAAFAALLDLQASSARVQLLLDAAASFYCGVALTKPAIVDTYAPDGSWQTTYPTDQICLNA